MTLEQAKEFRRQLMQERKFFVDEHVREPVRGPAAASLTGGLAGDRCGGARAGAVRYLPFVMTILI
jgi:hypothetical protein